MFRWEKNLKTFFALLTFTLILASRSSAGSDFRLIGTDQLHSLAVDNAYRLEGGKDTRFTIIDARTKKEYDSSHIFSAISIPENDFGSSKVLLPKDKGTLLVVYCDGADPTVCRKWAEKAETTGYANIAIYSEGFTAWEKKKMPVAPLAGGF